MDFQVETLQVIANEAAALGRRLQSLSLKNYPSTGLKQFIDEELTPINDELRKIFLDEAESLKQNAGSQPPDRISRTFDLWQGLSRIVEAISGADLKSHPLEVMMYFKDVVRALDGDNVEFITSPANVMNFTIEEVWLPFKSDLENYAGLKRQRDTRFVHFTFPVLHKDNALLGAIYAHELGHYIDRRNKLTEQLFVEASKHVNLSHLSQALQKSIPAITGLMSNVVLGPWIREIVADTIAIHLLGPAFHFAAVSVDAFYAGTVYPNVRDQVSIRHPSDSLRARHRVKLLDQLGFLAACPSDVQTRIRDIHDSWKHSHRVYDYPENHTIYDLMEPVLESIIPSIEQRVETVLPQEVRLKVSDLDPVADRLVSDRISWLIPPNELDGQPVSPGAILNAGWIAYHTELERIRSRIKVYEPEDKRFELIEALNGLIRHALYAARAHRRLAEIGRANP